MKMYPRNWKELQHYKDRRPPWIKLHSKLLTDFDFMMLPIASKALAPQLWLLASESEDGSFDGSIENLIFRLRLTKKQIQEGLKHLIDKGFFSYAISTPAECLHDAVPEAETEAETETETEAETEAYLFDEFWKAYPKKKNKGQAEKSWGRLSLDNCLFESVMQGVETARKSNDWQKDNGQFIPYPATWLNAKGWEDEYTETKSGAQKWLENQGV